MSLTEKSNNSGNRKQAEEERKSSQGSMPKEKFEKTKRRWYDHTLAELTDELIPEIPQEYILGFTTTDSDENLFNMYEVNITGDFSPFDSNGPQTQIRRVFPDLDSMIRFGCRPNPKVFNFPHMGNKNNAHLLGYMLCAKSVAERYSATLNMIEDSSIRIGNPVRFFAYDEHPKKPLASQENGSAVSSAYSDMSNSQAPVSLQDAANAISGNVARNFLDINAESLSSSGNTVQASMGGETGELHKVITEDGDDFNVTIGQLAGSRYKGVGASYLATQTDAQTIYYVSAIRRDIQMGAKESTMTLTLTHGRMLGQPSVLDQMMLLYKTYYDSNTGYCPDLIELNIIRVKYEGNTQQHVIKAGDTLISLAKEYYGLEIVQPQFKPVEGEGGQNEEDMLADEYSTFALTDKGQKSDVIDYQPYTNGWKRRTYESHGEYWKVSNGGTGSAEKAGEYTVYVYDFDQTRFVYVGLKEGGKGEYTEQQPKVADNNGQQSYTQWVKEVADTLYKEANKGSGATQESKTMSNGDAYVVKVKSDIDTKNYFSSGVFKNEVNINPVQQQLIEFAYAIVAMNPGFFGSSLAFTEYQINQKLNEHAGQSIDIPNNLIVGNLNVPSKKPESESETIDTSDPGTDPDVVSKQTDENGNKTDITNDGSVVEQKADDTNELNENPKDIKQKVEEERKKAIEEQENTQQPQEETKVETPSASNYDPGTTREYEGKSQEQIRQEVQTEFDTKRRNAEQKIEDEKVMKEKCEVEGNATGAQWHQNNIDYYQKEADFYSNKDTQDAYTEYKIADDALKRKNNTYPLVRGENKIINTFPEEGGNWKAKKDHYNDMKNSMVGKNKNYYHNA